jgi:acetoin:2,6-dichlorophenolindophenol oxidoreductase subunit alpha
MISNDNGLPAATATSQAAPHGVASGNDQAAGDRMNEPSPERQKAIYQLMLRMRYFDEEGDRQLTLGKVVGTFHKYCGEEAVGAGVCAHLSADDYIFSTHRGHGHCIAKGGDVSRMMAELFGRATGLTGGKGGSMHLLDPKIGMMGANGIVAGGIALATGAALASKMREDGRVAVSFFGDGAMNRGPLHEAANMAAIWDLPIVYVCENNGYAQYIPQKNITKVTSIKDMASAYGIPGVSVDGQNVMEVYEAAGEAIARARSGGGPTFLEARTYRYYGHNPGDPGTYRTQEEVRFWRNERDPIILFRQYLMERQALSKDEDDAIQAAVLSEIRGAIEFADQSPFPDSGALLSDVYAQV